MQKIDKHIEIVSSTTPGLSSMSERSREAIKKSLSKVYLRVGITIVNDLSDLNNLVSLNPDLVFLGMKFVPINKSLGFNDLDKVWISDYLTERGIICTGSSSAAHKLDLNKPLAKQYALDAGLATAPFLVLKANKPIKKNSIKQRFPLFVKPTNRGGGSGIDSNSVVHNINALKSKVESISKDLGSDSLIEQYLPGREFSVAIIYSDLIGDYIIMPIELVAPKNDSGDRILSYEVKDADKEQVVYVIDKLISAQICSLAIQIFHALGAQDYGRIDIRLDKNNTPHFLEANLIPSLLAGYGSFPKSCVLNKEIGYDSMLLDIVNLGFKRTTRTDISSYIAIAAA